MLEHTFCHLPGIGSKSEEQLWSRGICSWSDLLQASSSEIPLRQKRYNNAKESVRLSQKHLEAVNPSYFYKHLPSQEHWRLFPNFRDEIAYLDIETDGRSAEDGIITTIALYDGNSIHTYVHGQNLDEFAKDIYRYQVLVTFNGKCFDIPFIERFFKLTLHHAHIDLRYVLSSLGYKGGLKKCEEVLGIERDELKGVDGFFAVLLWNEFTRRRNEKALETLLAYNVADTINLEKLMIIAFNQKLNNMPLLPFDYLSPPIPPLSPYLPDPATIKRLLPMANQENRFSSFF